MWPLCRVGPVQARPHNSYNQKMIRSLGTGDLNTPGIRSKHTLIAGSSKKNEVKAGFPAVKKARGFFVADACR